MGINGRYTSKDVQHAFEKWESAIRNDRADFVIESYRIRYLRIRDYYKAQNQGVGK
jgi:hypothetical protein